MCGRKVITKNCGMLMFIPSCYKDQNMCGKAVNTYPSTIQFFPDRFKTQEMWIKPLILVHLYFILFLIDI